MKYCWGGCRDERTSERECEGKREGRDEGRSVEKVTNQQAEKDQISEPELEPDRWGLTANAGKKRHHEHILNILRFDKTREDVFIIKGYMIQFQRVHAKCMTLNSICCDHAAHLLLTTENCNNSCDMITV